jgi:hypothetical protein
MIRKDFRWLLLLTVLIPLAAWDRFIVPAGTMISDIMITHYPNLFFIQQSLATGQGIPLWSPLILSGYPFSANPLSTLWYPPAWLSLLFPLPLGINLVMGMHILIGVVGFYFLLAKMGLDSRIKIPGCLLFGVMPGGYTHVISGHFTWVCASAWLPWLFLLLINQDSKNWKIPGLSALFWGLILLADMRFAAYAGIFWMAFNLFKIFQSKSHIKPRIIQSGIALVLGAGIGTAVWLPLLEYAGLGSRSSMSVSDSLYLSLPPIQLTGLIVPGHPTSMEWIFYPGAMILLLTLIALSFLRKRPELFFWLFSGIVFLLWSLGENLPVNQLMAELPGISLLRVPSRGLYFFNISLLMISVITIDELLKNNPAKAMYLRLVTIFFALLGLLFQIVIVSVDMDKNNFILANTVCWLIITILIILFSYRRLNSSVFVILLGLFAVIDLMLVDVRLTNFISRKDAFQSGEQVALFVKNRGSNSRVFSPSYSIPQLTAADYSIELADGIDPLQLKSYSSFIRQAIGLTDYSYSVTLPPFKTGDPTIDNIGIKPSSELFGLLNVKYLISGFPIISDKWIYKDTLDDTFIYENPLAIGWAWVEKAETGDKDSNRVFNIDRGLNRIKLEAEGPGRLVLSEINYPGWLARVDGINVEINTAYDILRSINLPVGYHNIEFIYAPVLLYIGLTVSLFSFLASGILIWKWNSHGI